MISEEWRKKSERQERKWEKRQRKKRLRGEIIIGKREAK